MRKLLTVGAALGLFAAFAAAAVADTAPAPTPFPASSVGPVFIAAPTVRSLRIVPPRSFR